MATQNTVEVKPQFLSDILYEMGKKSNPKSNLSMGEAAKEMFNLIHFEQQNGKSVRSLWYLVQNACDRLNKEGWNYFKVSLFFES